VVAKAISLHKILVSAVDEGEAKLCAGVGDNLRGNDFRTCIRRQHEHKYPEYEELNDLIRLLYFHHFQATCRTEPDFTEAIEKNASCFEWHRHHSEKPAKTAFSKIWADFTKSLNAET
jgi:hypothetical protein